MDLGPTILEVLMKLTTSKYAGLIQKKTIETNGRRFKTPKKTPLHEWNWTIEDM